MKKLAVMLLVFVCLMTLVLFASCNSDADNSGSNRDTTTTVATTTPTVSTALTTTTAAITSADQPVTTVPATTTAAPITTAAPVTTAPVTTAAVTTEALTANGIPVSKLTQVSELVGQYDFKNQGLALMKLIIRDFYDLKGHKVLNGDGGQTTLWAVGSFMEALTSVYKAFPEDEEIKKAYIGLLDRGVVQYRQMYQRQKVNGVLPYYYNASAGNRDDYYYDDDEWIALQYLEAYKLLGDAKYLTKAQEILEFIWLGWGLQSDESIGNGGIPWHCKGNGPTTCSNAPAAYAFAIFSTLTEDEALSAEYLNRAKTVYDWVRKYLRHPQMINLYKDGPGNNWSGSYNNGVMIAVGSLLYQITGEDSYLTQAKMTARVAVSNNTKSEDGKFEFENDTENPWMNAWLVKGWYEFYKVDTESLNAPLNRVCSIMAYALENKLESGYLRIRLDEAPDIKWTEGEGENKKTLTNDHHSTDTVNLGGGVSMLMVLAEWAELYGTDYQK